MQVSRTFMRDRARHGFADGRHRIMSRADLLTTADAGGTGRGLPAI
jgi:hypothetical protein